MKTGRRLIRFDWAIKKLLRDKANFAILEGFLSELLRKEITIHRILESESNKEDANDKHNRVDILVEDEKGELIIVEVQNSKEYDYFHRILYGTSKVITEHIEQGEAYSEVKKVISVTIAYFDLGQGEDYVYHGTTQFKGLHKNDVLTLAEKQKELYEVAEAYQIYPEYYIIKVDQFDNKVKDKLDEWIYFLKNGEIEEYFSAQGLDQAKQKLNELNLDQEEKQAYNYYLKRLRDIASEQHTKMADAEDILLAQKARKELPLLEARLQEKDEALQEKDEALQEKNEALQEKDEALQEKDEALQEKDEALQEKDEALKKNTEELEAFKEAQKSAILQLAKSGLSHEIIASSFELTQEEVSAIIGS